MTVKFGLKTWSMLASLALVVCVVAGCTEEAPPDTPKPAPAASAPAKPAGDMKPAAPAPTPEKPKM